MTRCDTCVFYDRRKPSNCTALVAKIKEDCPFNKTSREYEEGQKKANFRLRSMDQVKQERIAKTYFGGRCVWNEP